MGNDNSKAYITGIVLGIIAAIISVGIFIVFTVKSGIIFGLAAVLVGVVSGGAVGLGYRLGKGKITNDSEAAKFLWTLTLFGLLGMLIAYFGPYLYFATGGLNISMYLTLIGFDWMDILFIAIGAYGGRWAGKKIGYSLFMKHVREQQIKNIKIKPKKK